ncbi:aldose epimerase family protein, partial [Pseudomonas syringae group genomosp. 7]
VYFGATIGRLGNRLAGGKISLYGKTYQVPLNDKTNPLHGGTQGFDKPLSKAHLTKNADSVGVKQTYLAPDGQMGFPG